MGLSPWDLTATDFQTQQNSLLSSVLLVALATAFFSVSLSTLLDTMGEAVFFALVDDDFPLISHDKY